MEQINLFENYVTLFSSVGNDANDKQYIGNKENKVCRFCGKKENEVSFSEIAHAIPEAIGNKELILYEECNECNHFFSENIEVHFDKITKPYKNIGQIKGKNKIPSYKTKDKKSRIDVKGQVVLKQAVDSPIYVIDKKNKIMTITYEIEPFIPAAVYKTLVKMALSVMPNKDLIDFKDAIQWILEKDHSKQLLIPLIIVQTFIPGPRPNSKPVVVLLRKKIAASNYPYCIFILAFGNIVYRIIVPSQKDWGNEITGTMEIPIFPMDFERNNKCGNIEIKELDFTSFEIKKGVKFPIKMSYDERIEKDPNSDEIKNLL